MKKFKAGKSLKNFADGTLTKAQMYRLTGGRPAATGSTKSICHVDGKDDSDVTVIVWHPIIA